MSPSTVDKPAGDAPCWCEPEAVLHSLYNFPHAAATSQQSAQHADALCGLLDRFLQQGLQQPTGGTHAGAGTSTSVRDIWTDLSDDSAAALRAAMTALRCRQCLTWFAEYGCALLAQGRERNVIETQNGGVGDKGDDGRGTEGQEEDDLRSRPWDVALHLIALDGWEFHVHSTPSSTQRTVECSDLKVLFCGVIPADKYGSLVTAVNRREEGARRRQRTNQLDAHEHSAAFLHAVVVGAISDVSAAAMVVAPALQTRVRGGFANVGAHSGADSVPETCWPLVKAVLQYKLERGGRVCWCKTPANSTAAEKLSPAPLPLRASPSPSPPSLLLRQALAYLDLWLLRRQLAFVKYDTSIPLMLTATMRMLAAAAAKAAKLAADGYDMSAFETACHEAEKHLRNAAGERAVRVASSLELPGRDSQDFLGRYRPPTGTLPPAFSPCAKEQGLAAARQRAERNLGSLPLLPAGASLDQILAALSTPSWSTPNDDDVAAQLALRSTERELFRRAVELDRDGGIDSWVNAIYDIQQVETLGKVVDAYRAVLQSFLATSAALKPGAVTRSELASRELLVVWTAYCLIHEAACREHPLVQQYGVFASHHGLRHLVLSDPLAVEAALSVAGYLRRCAVRAGGRELFTLRDGALDTMSFAAKYAASCPRLQRLLSEEQADAEVRVEAHWAEVRRKQLLAEKLKTQMAELQSEAAKLECEHLKYEDQLKKAQKEQDDYFKWNQSRVWNQSVGDILEAPRQAKRLVEDVERRLYSNKRQISSTQLELTAAERAPLPVMQPLPSSAPLARRWLFFVHMPSLLRHLSRASFLAQQMLLPRPIGCDLFRAIASEHRTSLVQYYNTTRQDSTYIHSFHQRLQGEDGLVKLWSDGVIPSADSIGPRHVDHCLKKSDGIWYPDTLGPCMAWSGSGSSADRSQGFPTPFFNPFAKVDEELVELYFTEKLQPDAAGLQWAMHVRGNAGATVPDRGNLAIAQQDTKPGWLDKPAFLELCTLRAYPLRQLRRLAAALHDRTLPLGHPAVHTFVRQLLYQLGILTDETPPRLLWRSYWDGERDVLVSMHRELTALAEELEQTPREHDAVLLLGEVASYLTAWYPPCGAVARRFAAMTARVADEMDEHIATFSGGDELATSGILAKQCRWRCMALLCWSSAAAAATVIPTQPLTEDGAAEMVRLMVLINHGRVFLHSLKLRNKLLPLFIRAHNVMVGASAALLEAVQRRPAMLTEAVSRVLQQRTLERLEWKRLGSTGSFEAVAMTSSSAADGRLFSINLLDGTVLFDGWPPGRLPKEVTEHPLYRRTFGTWSFDVALSTDGVMHGLRAVQQRLYDFAISGDGKRLVITETDPQYGTHLELLDVGEDRACGEWGRELPVILRQLHSQWLCRDQGILVLRPLDFQQHDIHYLVSYTSMTGAPKTTTVATTAAAANAAVAAACEYDCRRVPPHLRHHPWTVLLKTRSSDLPNKLVVLSGSVVKDRLLARFEDPSFIHTYISEEHVTHGSVVVPQQQNTAAAKSSLLLELPRFGLEFEMCPTDGQVQSRDYSGYGLRRRQLLVQGDTAAGADTPSVSYDTVEYTLPGFEQYLVLQRVPGTGAVLGSLREDVLVLVPAGPVSIVTGADASVGGSGSGGEGGGGGAGVHGSGAYGGCVRVEISKESNVQLKAHCYEVHGRFGDLRAASILARLQLAALYAASGTLLPEPLSRCTGGQTAMTLLRQCWGNRPLGAEEVQQLRSVSRLGGYLTPGLPLLAHDLEVSASELRHLHDAVSTAAVAPPPPAALLDSDAAILYHQLHYPGSSTIRSSDSCVVVNPRMLLSPAEEMRVLGVSRPATIEQPTYLRLGQYQPIEIMEELPVPAGYVASSESMLNKLVTLPQRLQHSEMPAYPLESLYGGGGGVEGADVQHPERQQRQGAAASAAGAAGVSALTPLEAEMHSELRDSWEAHHQAPKLEEHQVHPCAASCLDVWTHVVADARAGLESYMLRHLAHVPPNVGRYGRSFRLQQIATAVPVPGLLDLLRATWQGEALLQQFNPFLSPQALGRLHSGALLWAQLCVLEDRLRRLCRLAAAGPAYRIALVQELLVRRTWDVSQHPHWIGFEVEGQLQIRPAQYAVARHLMHHPGAIAQLNMGEGKTRVILPMLVLHWADGSRVVRLNFLSTLLGEAYSHLHQHLCAGVLGRKLFTMPFHRDVNVTEWGVRAMRASVLHCKQEGGLLLVAPEHRLSLLLKRQELWAQGEVHGREWRALDRLAALPYLDILDESDELLHHRLQFIYACGGPGPLPDLQQRTAAMQALLRIVSKLATHPAFNNNESGSTIRGKHQVGRQQQHPPPPLILSPDMAVLEPPADPSPGAFCGLRLLAGDVLTATLPALHRLLAETLMDEPPYELRYLRNHPLRDRILQCVTNESEAAETLLGPNVVGSEIHQLSGDQLAVVLSLRGLLACNLLQHCLQKRHRVEYGINRHSTARKRMAVPFRAAHTPSERSEFAQPDVALLLTNLSYYYDGLSSGEFRAALTILLRMGLSAQRDYYEGWLHLGRDQILREHLTAFDSVAKVDLSNSAQMELMYRYLRHNMAVVDFWLNQCVLPTESRQFPHRLASSAWNLSDNGRGEVVGFSGTNDNHRLLPLQVHQAQPDEPSLRATNGKMLQVILSNTLGYTTLQMFPQAPQEQQQQGGPLDGGAVGLPLWRVLLDTALAEGVDALLDCGALLAGTNNKDAAEYILSRLDRNRHSGVTYFDETLGCWTVRDLRGRSLPRHASPIAERHTLVIYDDARCRGADLQLRPDAVGLLTLGPGVCKDKLMQAAGRLRQLGRGQRLRFVAAPDVTAKVRRLSALTPEELRAVAQPPHASLRITGLGNFGRRPSGRRLLALLLLLQRQQQQQQPQQQRMSPTELQVLRWVMSNTVAAALHGLVQWSAHGLHFACTKNAPERALDDEVLKLDQLYGSSKAPQPVGDMVATRVRLWRERCVDRGGGELAAAMDDLMMQIKHRAALYGRGHVVTASTAAGDEECERELEKEEEEEQQVKRQVPRVKAAAERDWNYATALAAASTAQLDASARIAPLSSAVSHLLQPSSLGSLPWSAKVLCTANFLQSTILTHPNEKINDYLRPVGTLLLFPSGEAVMISEREADQLQELVWMKASDSGGDGGAVRGTHPMVTAGAPTAPLMVSLCYVRDAFIQRAQPLLAVHLGTGGRHDALPAVATTAIRPLLAVRSPVHATALVSVQLFNGEARYGSEDQRRALRSLVWRRREEVEALVDMRGKGSLLTRSDLERACEDD